MGSFATGALSGFADTFTGRKKDKDKDGKPRQSIIGRVLKRGMNKAGPRTGTMGGDPSFAGDIASYKRGGKVRRTGLARVHKGERVLTKRQARMYRRSGKRR